MPTKRKPKRPAIFFDRDGTLIAQVELLSKPSQLKIFPETAPAIKALNELGYLIVVVTNQPVVARGIITPKDVNRIHDILFARLAKKGARVDAVYFCPHHPLANMKKYRKRCPDRKPSPGMIMKAAKKYNIDLKKSFLIGDTTQDVLTGKRAKVRTILVKTGHGGKDPWQYDVTPDFVVKDLKRAVAAIRKTR